MFFFLKPPLQSEDVVRGRAAGGRYIIHLIKETGKVGSRHFALIINLEKGAVASRPQKTGKVHSLQGGAPNELCSYELSGDSWSTLVPDGRVA